MLDYQRAKSIYGSTLENPMDSYMGPYIDYIWFVSKIDLKDPVMFLGMRLLTHAHVTGKK